MKLEKLETSGGEKKKEPIKIYRVRSSVYLTGLIQVREGPRWISEESFT